MVEYPDEIDNGEYIQSYREKFNNLPAVQDNGLLLVSSGVDKVKSVLLAFCIAIVIILGIYVYLISSGSLTPILNNANNFTIENDFIIPPCPTVSCSSVRCGDIYLNYTLFNYTEVQNDTATTA
jgi:hypothetical protein